MMIDGYFVLRMFLEYYIKEKEQKIKLLETTSVQLSDSGKSKGVLPSISFSDFYVFMTTNFRKCSQKMVLKAYKFSWNFGNGKVTFRSFMAAAQLLGLFIPELKLESTV